MIKPSFRDVNNQGYKVEIETDDNGELITFTDRKVIITFAYTYDLDPNLMDYKLFTLEFNVSGSVTVSRFDNKSFDVTKLVKDSFHKIYTPMKRTIAKEKSNYGFNRAMEEIKKGLQTMDKIFDANYYFYEISDYLAKLGFLIPIDEVNSSKFPSWLDSFRKSNQDIYSQMVIDILERQEKLDLIARVGVIA